MAKIQLLPIKRKLMKFTIKGTSPLVTHNWDEKAIRQMEEKHSGKKTKNRQARNPKEECKAAEYRTAKGKYGIPGMGFKKALITAAHKDIGIEKTLVRRALFLRTDDPEKILELHGGKPEMRRDMVRVGMGSTDIRYRPMWTNWSVDVELEIDEELMTEGDVATLINRAGFGVGIGEMRPEKGGEYGRFEIDIDKPFQVQEL